MVQQAAPFVEVKKLEAQELQVLAAEQVRQLAMVQEKHWLPSELGKKLATHEVQTLLVAQV